MVTDKTKIYLRATRNDKLTVKSNNQKHNQLFDEVQRSNEF